jgi:hypothetical protein
MPRTAARRSRRAARRSSRRQCRRASQSGRGRGIASSADRMQRPHCPQADRASPDRAGRRRHAHAHRR